MRAAAIFGLGCSPKDLKPFQTDKSIEWWVGCPSANEDADAVLLFGGDGTIHRHLSQLVSLSLPVLIVPAGSGNDFARALGLRRVRDALGAWARFVAAPDNVRTIDLGVITPLNSSLAPQASVYFCCVAGTGLDSEVARSANQLPRWLRRHGGYALSLISAAFRFAPFPVKIDTADGAGNWITSNNQPTILAAIANAPSYGGGMKIAPQAQMDDGQLDVCVIGSINVLNLLCNFPTVYFGRHLGLREVRYFQSTRARVETERPMDVFADGEYVCQTPAEFAIQPGALKLITP
jgi:diacylglycerol kinase (ATP)